MRTQSTFVAIGGALLFFLYILPWRSISPIINLPPPKIIKSLGNFNSYNYNNYYNSRSNFTHSSLNEFKSSGIKLNRNGLKISYNSIVPYHAIINSDIVFNASDSDIMVLLHIQKTGGTSFERHIVEDLQVEEPCVCWKRKKRCKCPRPLKNNKGIKSRENSEPWLFSRYSTGWICGLHADWTELNNCVDTEISKAFGNHKNRRYFYMTMIREPIHRFFSEFRHVQRGATWKASRHSCDGRFATADELGSCFPGRSWAGVSLSEFLSCPFNMGFNRQTRMLADLSLIGCYNRSYMSEDERNRVMLASAKHNLESMAFVGLTEFQKKSQYIFEQTFGLRFKSPFTQNIDTYSSASLSLATPSQIELVKKLNSLDIQLYDFAQSLLQRRFEELKDKDKDFELHFKFLGQGNHHFSWDEIEEKEN